MYLLMKLNSVLSVEQREDKSMKKNRLIFNVLMLITIVAYAGILILGNVSRAVVPVATVKGSYANEFAKEKKLPEVEMTESEQHLFDLRYETFTYNEYEDGIMLESYNGISEILIVPAYIDDEKVVAIGEKFFENSETVKEIYLPTSVEEIVAEPNEAVTIFCNDNMKYYQENPETEWAMELVADSEFVNFSLGDIPFAYEKTENGVEIVRYYGNESSIIIPSYIDGVAVTSVSMDMLGEYELVVFPETVKSITGEVSRTLFTLMFAIEFAFTVVAFAIAFIVINVIMGRMKDNKEMLLTGPQYVLTYLFVLIQTVFGIFCIYKNIVSTYIALAVSAVLLILYLLYMFGSKVGRTHAVEVQEKRNIATAFMKNLKVTCAHLSDDIEDADVKKCVDRLVEDIKYSDPMSNEELEDIEKALEKAIEELKSVLSNGSPDEIKVKCAEVQKVLRTRNELCKKLK